jgi:hypothetical protein
MTVTDNVLMTQMPMAFVTHWKYPVAQTKTHVTTILQLQNLLISAHTPKSITTATDHASMTLIWMEFVMSSISLVVLIQMHVITMFSRLNPIILVPTLVALTALPAILMSPPLVMTVHALPPVVSTLQLATMTAMRVVKMAVASSTLAVIRWLATSTAIISVEISTFARMLNKTTIAKDSASMIKTMMAFVMNLTSPAAPIQAHVTTILLR